MFGLMRTSPCASEDARAERNKHYCGTCKSIGRLYGQRYRTLLNSDTVFMGEVLSAIAGHESQPWQSAAFRSISCLNLPERNDVPVVLRYSSACTLLLAELALRDKIADATLASPWQAGKKLLTNGVKQALADLEVMGVNVDQMLRLSALQADCELHNDGAPGERALARYSEPTAAIAGHLFSRGAELVNRPELASHLGTIGRAFGRLVYVLDAVQDYEEDHRRRAFNAVASAWRCQEMTLPAPVRAEATRYLVEQKNEIVRLTDEIQVDAAVRQSFIDRLEGNLHVNLYAELPPHWHAAVKASEPPRSWRGRWSAARKQAKALAIRTQVIGRDGLATARSETGAVAFLTLVCLLAPVSAGQLLAQGQDASKNSGGEAICGLIILCVIVSAVVNSINKATRKTGVVVVHKKGACE
jgi:hypothetical protein